jgi:hypothetical protein
MRQRVPLGPRDIAIDSALGRLSEGKEYRTDEYELK